MKPKLYKVNGLWYCKAVTYFGWTLLGVGKATPYDAFNWWYVHYIETFSDDI